MPMTGIQTGTNWKFMLRIRLFIFGFYYNVSYWELALAR